jgi:hypothetical protein
VTSPLTLQLPICVVGAAVVSNTCDETAVVSTVPEGNVIVTWLLAGCDNPPVEDVLNVTT